MDKESAVLLNAVAGLKLNLSDVKGDVDMCKAWEDYAKDYAKDLTMKSVRNMIRKGIPYEDARGILEGVSDEELRRLYAKEYAPKYMKDLTMKSVRNMIRKGITYEDARGILEGISDEELKQLYKEAEKEMAVL